MSNVTKFPNKDKTSEESNMVFQHTENGYMEKREDGSFHFPIGTSQDEIHEAMRKKLLFSMDIMIGGCGTPEERAKLDADRIAKKLENKNRW